MGASGGLLTAHTTPETTNRSSGRSSMSGPPRMKWEGASTCVPMCVHSVSWVTCGVVGSFNSSTRAKLGGGKYCGYGMPANRSCDRSRHAPTLLGLPHRDAGERLEVLHDRRVVLARAPLRHRVPPARPDRAARDHRHVELIREVLADAEVLEHEAHRESGIAPSPQPVAVKLRLCVIFAPAQIFDGFFFFLRFLTGFYS